MSVRILACYIFMAFWLAGCAQGDIISRQPACVLGCANVEGSP